MKSIFAFSVLLAMLLVPSFALAKGGHSSSQSTTHSSRATPGVARNSHGRIARSSQATSDFKKSQSCPSTGSSSGACPGYVIDHLQPLKRSGTDRPSNMQWRTKEAAKINA